METTGPGASDVRDQLHPDVPAPSEWWTDPGERERRRAWLFLIVVGLAVVVLHAGAAGLDRAINWDEAIHVSQVNPAVPAVFMEPHRTRGLSFLVAPVAVLDPSMVLLRSYVLLLGAAGTVAAFGVWIRSVGMAAPIAAALYSTFWITVFYTVEVLPNHPAALLTVWFVGATVAAVRGQPVRGQLAAFAVVMLVLTAVRPPDAVLAGLGIAAVALLSQQRRLLAPVAAAAAGGAAALVPWFLEGWIRFGFGPLATVRSAGEYSVDGGRTNLLPIYLRSIETRLRCAGGCIEDHVAAGAPWQLPPVRSAVFLAGAVVLVAVALYAARDRRLVVLAPLIVAAPPLVFYGAVGGAMNQRYLLPVYALALLPPAMGLRALWRATAHAPLVVRGVGVSLVAVVLVIAGSWSTSQTLDRFASDSTRDRAAVLGQALGEVTGREGAECVVAARTTYPQIQYWSGCHATAGGRGAEGQLQPPLGELGSYVDLARAVDDGADAYAVDRIDLPDASPLRSWERIDPEDEGTDGYVLYRHVPGAVLPPPPCPPESGPERRLAEVFSDGC